MHKSDAMYNRNCAETNKDMVHAYYDRNGFHANMFPEMYSDVSMSSPSSMSTCSSSISVSPLTNMPSSILAHSTPNIKPTAATLRQSHLMNMNTNASLGALTSGVPLQEYPSMASPNIHLQQHFQHHQQQLQKQQQLVAAVAQQQLALAAAVNTKQDEISKSLKMFAMLTAYNAGNEPSHTQSPVDAVMQDFACNGYICDELTQRYQQYQAAALQFANQNFNNNSNITNNTNNNFSVTTNNNNYNVPNKNYNGFYMNNNNFNQNHNASPHNQQHQQQHHPNPNLIDVRNYFWKMFPMQNQNQAQTQSRTAAAATIPAAVLTTDYNSSANRKQKRHNCTKSDKYISTKHCVFCENNNEPEAVVKSHAVRDTFGRVLCPKLRTYICPICKASGDMAHTVKYCPQKPIITMEDALKAESIRVTKSSYYSQQMKV